MLISNHKVMGKPVDHIELEKISIGCFEVEISPDFGTCSVAYQLGAGHQSVDDFVGDVYL